jgi:processive 1,2-diacylglycerol beta-glucosyltransferase
LILSASTGSGHLRAAEAIRCALGRPSPAACARHADALALATRAFRRCYGGLYLDFIDSHPLVLKYFYHCMDEPRSAGTVNGWDRLRLFLERLNLHPLLNLVRSEPWDLIVNTHFLPGELVGCLRRRGEIDTPQVMVTTDFETHRLWMTEPCEHYFTATAEGALYLQRMGIPAGRTSVFGIPVDPVFAEPKGRDECLARHGLRGDRPVVLQMAGGNGVGPIERLYQALLEVEVPLELVVVTGRNAAAKGPLAGLPVPPRHRVKVLGSTPRIDELMRAADLAVTKPGGLTVSEALAAGLPLVIVDPVPGQEERNSDYLLENGAAIKCNHLLTLASKVSDLLGDPGRLARLRANARGLGRPRAAYDVAGGCLALLPSATPRDVVRDRA